MTRLRTPPTTREDGTEPMSGTHEGCRDDRTNRAGWHAHCWADGFGVWHAQVTFPAGAERPEPDASVIKIRAFARAAMRAAIEARGNGTPFVCRVELVELVKDDAGQFAYIEYRERVTQ